MTLFPRVLKLLGERGAADIHVVAGGIIPAEDMQALRDLGLAYVAGPGTRTGDIVDEIRRLGGA